MYTNFTIHKWVESHYIWILCTRTQTTKKQKGERKEMKKKKEQKRREKRKANIAENLLVSNVIPYFLMTK